jgi:hypothetical protein
MAPNIKTGKSPRKQLLFTDSFHGFTWDVIGFALTIPEKAAGGVTWTAGQ